MASTLEQWREVFAARYEELVGIPVQSDAEKGVYLGETERHKHRTPPAIVWVPAQSTAEKFGAGGEEQRDYRTDSPIYAWRTFVVEVWCYGATREQADALHHNALAVFADHWGDHNLRLGQFEMVSDDEQHAAFNNAGYSIRQRVYLRSYVAGTIDHTTGTASSNTTALPAGVGHTSYFGTPDAPGEDCGHGGVTEVPEHDGDHTDEFS